MSFEAKVNEAETFIQQVKVKQEDVTSLVDWNEISPENDKYDDSWKYLETLFGHELVGEKCFVILVNFEKKSVYLRRFCKLSELRKDIHNYSKELFARKLYCFEFEKHDGGAFSLNSHDIRYVGRRIYVRARIREFDFDFILDTGATDTSITENTLNQSSIAYHCQWRGTRISQSFDS